MRVVFVVLLLAVIFGCEGARSVTELELELRNEKNNSKNMEQQLIQKDNELNELRSRVSQLEQEKVKISGMKEMGDAKIEELKWEMRLDEFYIELRGKVRNTGRAYLEDVTLKVALRDETDNIIDVELMPPYAPEKERMLKFFPLEPLEVGATQEFKVRISTKYFHANGLAAVKKCIDENNASVKILFRSK
ncbi:MAG: hypothetical protein N2234_05350 [Planctomycetota bacterium]|nr:hypothetical protein [Planctomycetota bacterium]